MRVALTLILAASFLAWAGEMSFSYSIDPDNVQLINYQGYDVPLIDGGRTVFEEGTPNLPGVGYSFLLPQGNSIEDISVVINGIEEIEGKWDIAPVVIHTLNEVPGLPVHAGSVYSLNDVFPENPVVHMHNGNKTGFRMGSFTFVPFMYRPLSGGLSLITSATITVTYAEDPSVRRLSLTEYQISVARDGLSNFVSNPEMLDPWAPALSSGTDGWGWIVISDLEHEDILAPLVTHRNSCPGGGATFVSTQYIYSEYSGYDTQEKIRNYIIDAFENSGLVYALIVGDFGETTRVSDLILSGQHLNSTADLYYGDLDGTWDADNDHKYGEYSDAVDYYSDIYTGRFPSDFGARLEAMIDRTLAYEQSPTSGSWQTTALLLGAGLWPPYYGSVVCDTIDKRIPGSWTVHKLYETASGHPTNQIALLNNGVSFCEPVGHGFEQGMYWYASPTNMITTSNYQGINNLDKMPVMSSIACLVGKISAGCLAEKLMYWENGGTIAFMVNSDNGWGTPPNMGPSEMLEVFIADQIFVFDEQEIGVAHGLSKDQFRAGPHMTFEEWVLQEHNLLGDPALLFIPGYLGVEDGPELNVLLPALSTPSPNPTVGNCSIAYDMPSAGNAEITVFDLTGRAVRTIHSGLLSAGSGSVAFDGMDSSGNLLPSGCYSVVITAQAGSANTRMLIVR